MKHGLVLLFFIFVCSVVGQSKLGPAKFRYHLLSWPGAVGQLAVVFQLDFKRQLLADNGSISSPALSSTVAGDGTEFCISETCMPLPQLSSVLQDSMYLSCTALPPTPPPTVDNSTEPSPPPDQPLSAFVPLVVIPDVSNSNCIACVPASTANVSSTSLQAFIVLPYTHQRATDLLGSSIFIATDSSDPFGPPQGVVASLQTECAIVIQSDGPERVQLRYQDDGSPVNTEFHGFERILGECTVTKALEFGRTLRHLTRQMRAAPDLSEATAYFYKVIRHISDRQFSDCRLALDARLQTEQALTVSPDSSACVAQPFSKVWMDDPCCNPVLRFTTCCAPRNVTYYQPKWKSTFIPLANDPFAVLSTMADCPLLFSPDASTSSSSFAADTAYNRVFADYSQQLQRIGDLDYGCLAEPWSNELMDKSIGALQRCFVQIYGPQWNGLPCLTDKDCYTSCDRVSSRCVIPWTHPELAIAECLLEELPEFIMRYLRFNLGLPGNAPAQTLAGSFVAKASADLCIGPTAFLNPYTNATSCGEDKFCNWQECPSGETDCQAACLDSSLTPTFCGECATDGTCREVSERSGCVDLTILTLTQCTAANGHWVALEAKCYLPFTALDTCLPSAVCSATSAGSNATVSISDGVDWNRTRCDPLCYDSSLPKPKCVDQNCDQACCDPSRASECVDSAVRECVCAIDSFCCDTWDSTCTERAMYTGCVNCNCVRRKWDPLLNDQQGMCLVLTANVDKCTDDYQANATWWPGRLWQYGRFSTEERCNEGLCDWNQAYSSEQCNAEDFCNGGICATCVAPSGNGLKFACSSDEAQAACQGTWDATLGTCLYATISDKASCTAQGVCAKFPSANFYASAPPPKFQFTSCATLSPRECNRCVYNLSTCALDQRLWKCELKLDDCDTEAQCLATGGACDDEMLHFSGGSCAYGFIANERGGMSCAEGTEMTDLGCLNSSITDPIDCTGPTAKWLERAFSKQECDAFGAFCESASFDLLKFSLLFDLTLDRLPVNIGFGAQDYIQSGMDCSSCAACGGECHKAVTWAPATWTKGSMSPLKWQPRQYLSENQFTRSVSPSLLQSLLENSIADRLQESLDAVVSCRYGVVWQRVEQIFKFCAPPSRATRMTTHPPRAAPLAYRALFYNSSEIISALPAWVEVDRAVVGSGQKSLTVEIGVVSALTDLLPWASPHGQRYGVADIVRSESGYLIGAVYGDGVSVNITSTEPVFYNATLQPSDGNMTVCMQVRFEQTGLWAILFTTRDVSFAEPGDGWTSPFSIKPLFLDPEASYDIFNGEDWMCINVTKSGYYFPVIRTWVFDHSEVLATVVAAFFILVSIASLAQLTRAVIQSEFNIPGAVLCCLLVTVACAIRGAHLLLVAKINLQQLYPEDYIYWHALVVPGLFFNAVGLGLYFYTKVAPPSAETLEFKSPKTKCTRTVSILSTAGVIALPALIVTALLGGFFYYLNLHFALAWEPDTRTLVTSIDRGAFWMTCILGMFYLGAVPIRFWWRSKYRNHPWHFTVWITGAIALIHYGHILMMLITMSEFGTTLADVIHMAVFLALELILSSIIIGTLQPLKLPARHERTLGAEEVVVNETEEDAIPLLLPEPPPPQISLAGCASVPEALSRVAKHQMLSREHKFALGAKSQAHVKALEQLIPSQIEPWKVIDIFMMADSRAEAIARLNALIATFDPDAPKFE